MMLVIHSYVSHSVVYMYFRSAVSLGRDNVGERDQHSAFSILCEEIMCETVEVGTLFCV